MVCLKLRGHLFTGIKVLIIFSDNHNEASLKVLNTMACRNSCNHVWGKCYLAAIFEFHIKDKHLPGVHNRMTDFLSNWSIDSLSECRFEKTDISDTDSEWKVDRGQMCEFLMFSDLAIYNMVIWSWVFIQFQVPL